MTFNLADLFEAVADRIPDRAAVVYGERRLTYRDLDRRANRLADALRERGVREGEHVGLYLYNCAEYLEAMFACFKLRAAPININYRYVEDELAYIANNADLVGIVYHEELGSRVAAVRPELPSLRHVFVVLDGSGAAGAPDAVDYETAVAAGSPERDFPPRSSDDTYILYTGGTTGQPKGVVWRHEDIFFAAMAGAVGAVRDAQQLAEKAAGGGGVMMPICPLVHASGQWGSMGTLFAGGTVVLSPDRHLDPARILRLVESEKVTGITVVGDAAGRPIADELAAHPGRYDVGSLALIASGGSIFSPTLKARFLELVPHAIVVDAFGASESGAQGMAFVVQGGPPPDLTFTANEGTAVVDDDLMPVRPGEVGRVARSGHVPLRYHRDEERSRTTFFQRGGVRWSLPGDMGRLEVDGSITLLGRGSLCINTGGEKVYPEEVEAALRSHPDVVDALVTGVPDDRWGQVVAAVVQPRTGAAPSLDSLVLHCRGRLAGYKLPKRLHLVDEVRRSPAGKGDYGWAVAVASGVGAGG